MTFTLKQIMDVAQSLCNGSDEYENMFEPVKGEVEYYRGICELIGRLALDFAGKGDGTDANAQIVAAKLNVRLS